VAQTSGHCGNVVVHYDDRCSYGCMCIAQKPGTCHWVVSCPDGKGGWYDTEGDDADAPPGNGNGHKPGVKVQGRLAGIAVVLAKLWDRPVTCPPDLGGKEVNRRFEGSPEEIARALGLELPNKA
jgi:hypothetical protein